MDCSDLIKMSSFFAVNFSVATWHRTVIREFSRLGDHEFGNDFSMSWYSLRYAEGLNGYAVVIVVLVYDRKNYFITLYCFKFFRLPRPRVFLSRNSNFLYGARIL